MVDITHPNAAEQAETVERTLDDLGVAGKPRLTVLNKVDALARADGRPVLGLADLADLTAELDAEAENVMLVSAARGWGLDELRERIAELLADPAARRQRRIDDEALLRRLSSTVQKAG